MKHYSAFVLFVLAAAFFASCSKDDGTEVSRQDLLGTWNFIQLSNLTEASLEATEAGLTDKVVTKTVYASTNNRGTFTITENEFVTNGVAYDAVMDVTSYFYENGDLLDSITLQQNVSISPSSGRTSYRLIGSDSLVLTNGASISGSSSSPTSGRLILSGNELTMRLRASSDSTFSEAGVNYRTRQVFDVRFLMRRP